MLETEVQKAIQQLSEDIFLADGSKPDELARLHEQFVVVEGLIREMECARLFAACKAGTSLLDGVIQDEVEDAGMALDSVAKAIAYLQAVLVDGQKVDDIQFPTELDGHVVDSPSAGNQDALSEESTLPSGQPDNMDVASSQEALSPTNHPAVISVAGDTELAAEFVTESQEHLEQVEADLLTIESITVPVN